MLDEDGEPQDLTNCTSVRWGYGVTPQRVKVLKSLGAGILIVGDPLDGKIEIEVGSEDSVGSRGINVHEAWATIDGRQVPIMVGEFRIQPPLLGPEP